MSTQVLHTPYAFDTEFDDAGQIVRPSTWQPPKKSYNTAEVEALVAQARTEARMQALNEVEALRANALSTVAQCVADAMTGLSAVTNAHRQEAADIALCAARVIASSACEQYPRKPLEAALDQLGQELESVPRLVVRALGLDEAARQQIEARCDEMGFTGVIAFRDDPSALPAAFSLEWADGRADYDPDAVAARVESALKLSLESEIANASDPERQDDPLNRSAY